MKYILVFGLTDKPRKRHNFTVLFSKIQESLKAIRWLLVFELNGKQFMGLNGGPVFKFNEAVSFVVDCENQEEIDYYWEKLTEGGEESMCGWLKDKYGVSWQIVPVVLKELMGNPEKASRVVEAFMQMKKV